MDYRIILKSVTEDNKLTKYTEAVSRLAKAMKLPVTVKPRKEEGKEEFSFVAQEQLVNQWKAFYGKILDNIYYAICKHLDLPVNTTFSKAIDDDKPLIIRGKLMFNPETGKPLARKDWNNLIEAIEKFLNRKLKGAEEKIVLDSAVLGRIMSRMLKYNTDEVVRRLKLEDAKYKKYTFDYLSESLKTYREKFNPPDSELFQLQLAEDSLATHITAISQDTMKGIREVFLQGIKQKKGKGKIAQDLFDKFGDKNKDWERIIEFEMNDNFNNSFVQEEIATSKPGDKIYMRRMEMGDAFVCSFCSKIKGILVLVVNEPLEDENINDKYAKIAIWEGKSNIGRGRKEWWIAVGAQHPYCRGSWTREHPEKEEEFGHDFETVRARREKENQVWGEALEEVKAGGAKESDKDFLEKVKDLFNQRIKEG